MDNPAQAITGMVDKLSFAGRDDQYLSSKKSGKSGVRKVNEIDELE